MIQRGDVFLVNLDPVVGSEVGLCEQIRTLSIKRLLQHLGSLPAERLDEIRTALDRHLWF